MATVLKVHVENDGSVRIPTRIWQELGVEPPQEVEPVLGVQTPASHGPVHLTEQDQENLKQIGALIRETFADMDWEDVHQARKDRQWL